MLKGYFYNARVHSDNPKFSCGTVAAKDGSEAFRSIIKSIAEQFCVTEDTVEIVTLNKL